MRQGMAWHGTAGMVFGNNVRRNTIAKETNMMLRICREDKRRIVDAANASGKSVTDFVIGAAMKLASTVESKDVGKKRSGLTYGPGVPRPDRAFRVSCETARNGGSKGYMFAGYQVVGRCSWGTIRELRKVCQKGREPAILQWLSVHAPTYLAVVPKRRHNRFAAGVLVGVELGLPMKNGVTVTV